MFLQKGMLAWYTEKYKISPRKTDKNLSKFMSMNQKAPY